MTVFVVLWWLGSAWYGPFILPSPLEACAALWRLTVGGEALRAALLTSERALGGFAIAGLAGSGIGILAGLRPGLAQALKPVTSILLGIPPIAWIVLAMLWFGTTGLTPLFTVVVTTLPITFAVAVEGARTRDAGLEEMARSFKADRLTLLWDVHLPHILSYLFPGWITALGLAWKVAVMAELLASADGIGANLALARINMDTAEAFAWIIAVVVLLLAVEMLLLQPLQQRIEPWRRNASA
ncbi:ABC transporter permease subunit [Pseudodesulfovibrio cashew]|uniref:ABC transporter permease subunit n=1 Tax=Pseudodesulfovibrio cashew TaxID=2678688 RepID=A0A6I6JL57_9BACT|nr:ABC transporter permease subunit [Pseudodesulfovibrio cashew]